MEAQTAIFTIGNSAESIFELQYRISDNLKNSIVNSLFGPTTDTHLQANKESLDLLFNGGTTGETDTDGGKWDSRVWTCCQSQLTTGTLISSLEAARYSAEPVSTGIKIISTPALIASFAASSASKCAAIADIFIASVTTTPSRS